MHYSYLYSSFYNVQNSTEGYNKINNWPLNFLRTGVYDRTNGNILNRTIISYHWTDLSGSATYGHNLYSSSTNVIIQNNYLRGNGFAIRCVTREG